MSTAYNASETYRPEPRSKAWEAVAAIAGALKRHGQALAAVGGDRLTSVLWGGLAVAARLLRRLLSALARASGQLARALDRAARQVEATEIAAGARTLQFLPAELMLEGEPEAQSSATIPVGARLQPPPIPADAGRRPTTTRRKTSEQERAWQELTNGRHPRLVTRPLSPPPPSAAGRV